MAKAAPRVGPPSTQCSDQAAAAAATAGDRGHADRGEDDLEQELDPVHAGGVLHADQAGQPRADEGRDDADDDGQQDRDALTTAHEETAEDADHGADDDGGDDAFGGHGNSLTSRGSFGYDE